MWKFSFENAAVNITPIR